MDAHCNLDMLQLRRNVGALQPWYIAAARECGHSRLVHACNVQSVASLSLGVLHCSPIYGEYRRFSAAASSSSSWSLVEDTLVVPIRVKGRLKASLQYWKELEAPGLALEAFTSGNVLPLMSEPAPYAHRNQASASLARMFVQRVSLS